MKMMTTVSLFEIFSMATILLACAIKSAKEIVAFVRKVNTTHKSLIRLRKTVNGHTTRITVLENRLNNR